MKSLDPWRVIQTTPSGEVIFPTASYGHPFYREIPSWIHYGNGNGNGNDTHRLLFDGAFIGAEAPPLPAASSAPSACAQRTGLTAEVAPVIAPASGGISVRKELDDKQVLHVEICVDGKCYRTTMDLAPAISLIMQKLARWHEGQHAKQVPPAIVVGCIDAAVGEAVNAIVGELVGNHVDTICGSFLDDIGNAVSSAASGLAGGVVSTFKALKGPIGAAAGIAAATGAMAIPGVGPFVAPMAGKLANDLVQSATGDDSAKQRVVQANQQAKTNPTVAVALDLAQKAVANSTVAHHVQETAKRAARGHPAAQQQIVQVAEDAEKGDPAAKAVADLIANAMHSEWGAKLWERATGRGPAVSGWVDIVGSTVVGGFFDDVKDAVLTVTGTKATNQFIKDHGLGGYVKMAATAVATAYGGPAAGAAAGALSGPVMNLGVEDKQQAAAAAQDVQGVKTMASQTSPQLAQAADIAHGAIDRTATTYHVAHMVKAAKAGDLRAQRHLAKLNARAAAGDAKAARALQLVAMIDREQQTSPQPSVGQWYDIANVVVGVGWRA
jgi:hypothetical protein